MTNPVRLQLSRRKGFSLQAWSREVNGLSAVKVDRSTRWCNPFRVHHPGSAFERPMSPQLAVFSFKLMLAKEGAWFAAPLPWPPGKIPADLTTVAEVREQLRAKNLACWCGLCAKHAATGKPFDEPCADCAPCHVDILGLLANAPICEAGP